MDGDVSEGVQQISGRAGETIEARPHQHVAGFDRSNCALELIATVFGAGRHLTSSGRDTLLVFDLGRQGQFDGLPPRPGA
jgi:hypothetical protein